MRITTRCEYCARTIDIKAGDELPALCFPCSQLRPGLYRSWKRAAPLLLFLASTYTLLWLACR